MLIARYNFELHMQEISTHSKLTSVRIRLCNAMRTSTFRNGICDHIMFLVFTALSQDWAVSFHYLNLHYLHPTASLATKTTHNSCTSTPFEAAWALEQAISCFLCNFTLIKTFSRILHIILITCKLYVPHSLANRTILRTLRNVPWTPECPGRDA